MIKIAQAVAMSVLLVSCSGVQSKKADEVEQPEVVMQVDIAVQNLKSEDEDKLEAELAKIDGVYNLRRDKKGKAALFIFEYEGDFERLRNRIEDIEYPGLRRESIVAQLAYDGYDNRSPIIDIISPNTDEIITETSIEFVVEVKDSDVESVTVNGKPAKEKQPGFYHATVEVPEGEHEVEVLARDEAGNEARETLMLEVDTTPPELEASVKVVVEGKVEPGSSVYVDGKQAEVNMFGSWRIELTVKKGQKTVEVVAIDKVGNKRVEQKPIGL